jgi:hypothetical protein
VFYIAEYLIFVYSREQQAWAVNVTRIYKMKIVHNILTMKREEKRHLTDLFSGLIDQDMTHFGYHI